MGGTIRFAFQCTFYVIMDSVSSSNILEEDFMVNVQVRKLCQVKSRFLKWDEGSIQLNT
jgi:hypothetical protein